MQVDFTNVEAAEPNTGTMLPVGNHIVRIVEAEENESTNGNPGVALLLENNLGDIRDWRYLSSKSEKAAAFTREMIMQLASAAGDRSVTLLRGVQGIPSQEWSFFIASLKNNQVGIIVREEPNNRAGEPNQPATRRKVQAYVPPSELNGSDIPGDTSGFADTAVGAGAASKQDDSIPF